MNTQNNDNITVRTVTPQFFGNGNLGEYSIKTVGFTPDTLRRLVEDDKVAAGIADMMNAQSHIKFSSPTVVSKAMSLVMTEQGESESDEDYAKREPMAKQAGEKRDAWLKRIMPDVKEAVKEVVTETLDFPSIVKAWALSERREAADKREVLANYDGTIASVSQKWAGASAEAQAKLLSVFKLPAELAGKTTADVLDAIKAKYRPAVKVDAEDILG